ncbi:MAG: nucleotidyl transferase AbiEii/AbiGii toxin family protein [Armatimonadota bacterium]
MLSKAQRRFLRFFARLPDSHYFYLTGGTALSEFYLAHRYSYDLDLFTGEAGLLIPFCHVLEQRMRRSRLPIRVVRRFETFVEYLYESDDAFRIQLAVDSPFRFAPPVPTRYGVLVNDWDDLCVDKLLAFYGRVEPRDAIDVYCILQREDMDRLLHMAIEKDPGFDLYWFAVACQRVSMFPDDLTRWGVQMIEPIEITSLKACFQAIADEMMTRIGGV